MTTAAQKTTAIVKDERVLVRDLVTKMKPQIKMALPRHMDPDRMARVFLTAVMRAPLLLKCTQESLMAALMTASQLGLEPDGMMGHGYLIPFNNRKKGVYECQFMPGYRGLMKVARQSGEIVSLYARAVFRKDHFIYRCGIDEAIDHVPYEPDMTELTTRAGEEKWDRARFEQELSDAADRGVLRAVYAVAKFKDGGYQFEVMSRLDVDLIRARSKSADEGPWVTDYDAMALKSVMKRLCKWIPGSIEKDMAVGILDRAEAGLPQDLGSVIDTTAVDVVAEEKPQEPPKGALDKIVAVAESAEVKTEMAATTAEIDQEPIEAAMERWHDMIDEAVRKMDRAPADKVKRQAKKRLAANDERLAEILAEYDQALVKMTPGYKPPKPEQQTLPTRETGSDDE